LGHHGRIPGPAVEIAKVALILVLARLFAEHRGAYVRWPRLMIALVLAAVPVILVVLQPDLGTALTFIPIVLGPSSWPD